MVKDKEQEIIKPPKIKVHVTVDEDVVKWMDSQIEAKNFHNRSHAIEKALHELMKHSESKT